MNYILSGTQSPLIKKALKKILKERLGEPDDFNVTRFDLNEDDVDEIISEFSMFPLGYDRKAVVIDNASFLSGGNKTLAEKFNDNLVDDDAVDIIFISRDSSLDEKLEIFNKVKENGTILHFNDISKDEWPIYVKKYFTEKGVKISPDAIKELVTRCDNDLTRFINEANKLCLYKDNISLLDITLMVAKPIEDDVFRLVNALFMKDNALALDIFRDLKLLGSRSTDSLIPMLANQFRFVNQTIFLYKKGLSNDEIARELNAKEFRVKKALQNARSFPKGTVAKALDNLYQLDYKIKSGQIDRFYGMELFLINFPN